MSIRRPAFGTAALLVGIAFLPALASTSRMEWPDGSTFPRGGETVASNEPSQQESAVPRSNDPADILRSARTIFVRTRTKLFKPATLESELQNRPEFGRWGLLIATQESAADLIIEVQRVRFTNKYPYKVIDPRAGLVVLSGNVNSLGGTVASEIAKEFVQKMLAVRPLPELPTKQ